MRVVQSLWCNQKNLLEFKAGWYAPEYHLMGWALSCLQLRKYYEDVVLHADSAAAAMLIDTLRLPYTKIVCDLDKLNSYHPKLWALPKIHTYSQQTMPFLHVDGDVMIWGPFDNELLKGELIAQNIEEATSYYENMMKSLKTGLTYIPPEIIQEGKKNNSVCSYNAGILGGTDVEFFTSYAKKAMLFIDKNVSNFPNIDVDAFNILFEQYLFHALVHQSGKKVNVLLNEIIGDNEYNGFGDFTEVPYNKQYLHLIGSYKRYDRVCEQLANRLRLDYPEYYYRIIALFKGKQVPLKRDYYYFIDQYNEKDLAERYTHLKNRYDDHMVNNTCDSRAPEITRFRVKLIEDVIACKRNRGEVIDTGKYAGFVNDAKLFEDQLAAIVQDKFAHYPREYLYARDITHTPYFQMIFENKEYRYSKKLIADKIVEIAGTQFDWSRIKPGTIDLMKVMPWPEELLPEHHTAIVPECDLQGYTLAGVDDLDLLLLEIMEKPVSITEIMNLAKPSFDPSDLEESRDEFEALITGRIKLLLEKKIIKLYNAN